MANQASELKYAVRYRVVFKYFGQLCLVLAGLTLVPLMISILYGETAVSLRFALMVAGLAGLGGGLSRLPAPAMIQTNEGLVLVALIFLGSSLVMSYPMMEWGLSFSDAFFESISGVTTTGLSIMTTLVGASPTFLFTRAWLQWYGGLGIVVFSLALVMQQGQVAKGLSVNVSDSGDLIGGTRAHARQVLKIYVLITVLGIAVSWFAGAEIIDAIIYTLASVSTGGFAPKDESLAALAWPVRLWLTLLCLACAIPLTFYYRLVTEYSERRLAVDFRQLQALVITSLAVTMAVGFTMWLDHGMAWPQILHHAPVLAISAQTTTGFSSMPVAQLDAGSKLILIFSMLVGGGVGSTAGGFKLLRLLIVASVLRLIIVRACLPTHAVIEPRLAGRRLECDEINGALLLIVLYFAVVTLSWLPFVVMGNNPLDSLFEVVSAIGTVGLSVGLSSSNLPGLLKGILCFDMLMGRLEIIAWLVLLYPGTWFGRRMEET